MDRKLTSREKLIFLMHYSVCSVCRQVTKQMNSLRRLVYFHIKNNESQQPDPKFIQHLREELQTIANSGQPDQKP